MNSLLRIAALALALATSAASAEELFMARSPLSFPEAMLALQEAITKRGYVLSRVQHVDVGLTEMGFATDKYRIVFFGKPDEIRGLSARYPQLVPYLPLQVTIFAEGEETLVVGADPLMLRRLVNDAALTPVLQRWHDDLVVMMESLRRLD
ncbi:MAG: DUF302 domain-containing protein [Thiohalomonadaceae bacterium]